MQIDYKYIRLGTNVQDAKKLKKKKTKMRDIFKLAGEETTNRLYLYVQKNAGGFQKNYNSKSTKKVGADT